MQRFLPVRSETERPGDASAALVRRALRELAGVPRGLFYEVPLEEAPRPVSGSPVYLQGTPAWREFLADRERLDDGGLTLVLALRRLDAGERRAVIDWGNTYANAFLLVEPSADIDLTDRVSPARRRLEQQARELLERHEPDERPGEPWTCRTPLGALLRRWYGGWVCWRDGGAWGEHELVRLELGDAAGTLGSALEQTLAARYPSGAFDAAFDRLLRSEPELFSGRTVEQARLPFLTRLGLPVVHDPGAVTRAVRRSVNEGRAWVYHREQAGVAFHGPARPLPADWPDELVERLVL